MKKIFTSLIIFIIFFELLSVVFTHLDLFVINERPKYSYEKKFLHIKKITFLQFKFD